MQSGGETVQYHRVLLKISGEGLMGEKEFGLAPDTVKRIALEIKSVYDLGVEVCCVVGGGNIFRGVSGAAKGMDRVAADYVGMLATVINALTLQSAIENLGIESRVQSALSMPNVCESFIRRRAIRHLEKKRIVIFAAGSGNPFFTTDTAAALRAAEMNCDILLKATQVDGIYDSDPHQNPAAQLYKTLSFMEVLSKDLKVMDAAAISLCREKQIPIIVFNLHKDGSFCDVIKGRGLYTLVSDKTVEQ